MSRKGKLYFRYGTMGSAKTALLLTTAYNFEERNMSYVCMKPVIDTRENKNVIRSRIGIERECQWIYHDTDLYQFAVELYDKEQKIVDWYLVDEAQFLTREQVMKMLQTPTILIKLAQVLNLPAEKIAELFKEIFWQEISPGEMNRLLHLLLEKVEVHEGKLTVEFKSSGIKTLMEEIANGEETD